MGVPAYKIASAGIGFVPQGRRLFPRSRSTSTSSFGASSMERLPTEIAMTENMKRFKALEPSGSASSA